MDEIQGGWLLPLDLRFRVGLGFGRVPLVLLSGINISDNGHLHSGTHFPAIV